MVRGLGRRRVLNGDVDYATVRPVAERLAVSGVDSKLTYHKSRDYARYPSFCWGYWRPVTSTFDLSNWKYKTSFTQSWPGKRPQQDFRPFSVSRGGEIDKRTAYRTTAWLIEVCLHLLLLWLMLLLLLISVYDGRSQWSSDNHAWLLHVKSRVEYHRGFIAKATVIMHILTVVRLCFLPSVGR